MGPPAEPPGPCPGGPCGGRWQLRGERPPSPHTAHGRRCVHRPVGRRTATYGVMPVRQDAPAGERMRHPGPTSGVGAGLGGGGRSWCSGRTGRPTGGDPGSSPTCPTIVDANRRDLVSCGWDCSGRPRSPPEHLQMPWRRVGCDDQNQKSRIVGARFWAGLPDIQPNGCIRQFDHPGPAGCCSSSPQRR